jgi:hypothetical protein
VKLAEYQAHFMEALLGDETSLFEEERINIYRRSVLGVRYAALQQIFPCIKKIVGDNCFQGIAEDFLYNNPSYSYKADEVGEKFPAYLKTLASLEQVPYCVDMAKFEWCWHRVFHGRNNSQVLLQPLSKDSKLPLDYQLLSSCYPLHEIWAMCQPEYEGDFEIKRAQDDYYFLLYQRQSAIEIKPLTRSEYDVLLTYKKQLKHLNVFTFH